MYLAFALLVVLAPSLGALALGGRSASAKFQVWRYTAFTLSGWLVASLCLYGLLVYTPLFASFDLANIIHDTNGFLTLAAVCVLPFALVGSVLYCWGSEWSNEGHVTLALSVSLGASALAVPLMLLSTCIFQSNCL